MRGGIAYQKETRVVGHVRPLVQVEGDRLRPLHAAQKGTQARRESGQCTEGTVDVEPQFLGRGDIGNAVEIVDRTGLILSPDAHVVTRLRRTDANTMEAQITVDDPKALTKPWTVTKRYRKLPPGSRVYDYVCAENNRNPITESGRTLTLGSDGKPIDRVTR